MPAPSHSLLGELRRATSSAHAELDRELGLLEDGVTRERYASFLRGSLSALEPLEIDLRTCRSLERVPYRERAPSLRADLAALGVSAGIVTVTGSPHLNSEASVYGARYVIEGSALGGAVLARALERQLHLQGEALAYLTLYGAELSEHWRAFVNELEAWNKSATLVMRAEACDTARAVFASYREAFERAGTFSHR